MLIQAKQLQNMPPLSLLHIAQLVFSSHIQVGLL